MVKLYKIRFLKDTELKKVGDIVEATKKNADSAVSQGYAEYVNETPEISTQNKGKDSSISTVENIENKEVCNVDSSVTSVTDVTGVTSVTSVTSTQPVTLVTCNIDPSKIFDETLIDKILYWFLSNKNIAISVADLGEKLGKKKEVIRGTINRYKQYFSVTGSKGTTQVLQVSQIGMDEINKRQTEYLANQTKIKESEEREKQQKLVEENYDSQVASFLMENKLVREGNTISINFSDILEQNPALADLVLENPNRLIDKINDYYQTTINVVLINLPKQHCISIEQIRKEHLDKIISIDGRVTSFGEVKPVVLKTIYECPSCGTIIQKTQNYRIGLIDEPARCGCGRRGGFCELGREEVNACFIQLEDLQDKTDNPHSQRIKAVIFNGLCNEPQIKMFSPGNEIRCTGIIKRVPIFKAGKETTSVNLIYEIMSAELLEREVEIQNISEEDLLKINNLSKEIDEKGLDPILASFAPDVHGYESIKSGLILQACNKRNDRRVKTVRNKPNILIMGDPGVAKSVMCDFALSIQNGRKAVGGGSSAVGITASVVKEEDSLGGYRVEPGAMILAKDLLFLDELNNLSDEDKPKLQEGMNEQTISINKANLHVQMKVSAGILAVANPKNGHFIDESEESLNVQFNIPTPILNRFDAIFMVKDNVNTETDRKIAEKMIRRHRGKLIPNYSQEFLKLFFTYIKHCPEPEIDDNIQELLQQVYISARSTTDNSVRINPRFLESLTRLSTSAAKIRQSRYVQKKDIQIALNILSDSQYKINPYLMENINA